ncbi:uncharacterized protein PHACADRAFT_33236 [Phanerochaete carnosa HHB-10118-sp]|uniref:Uncharacterized protein n=1 Tax=Phanerochaete carnosa (strain HHB-10118-sp) TaxID=650164 RepID=K5VES1_PHACS|nr:uncharacterized protein PHACADRAFT_33236 [Phanerochaete carnosa HHB-10118-sp]EKM49668.1 hypothetical protein PHACADRAFT_33236 [Phanerochaete carnosa HHB-10118-sp]
MSDLTDGLQELLERHRNTCISENAMALCSRDEDAELMRVKLGELLNYIEDLKDEILQLKSKKKSSKAARSDASAPVVMLNQRIIEVHARMYTEMYSLWIMTTALSTPIQNFDPSCNLFRPSRFAEEALQAETEQIHLLFHRMPADANGSNEKRNSIMALIGQSPAFEELFTTTANSHCYSWNNKIGKAMLSMPIEGICKEAWTDQNKMANDPIAQWLRGDINNDFSPVLFHSDRISEVDGLFNSDALAKWARFSTFGQTSISRSSAGNAGALKWGWNWITPQYIASIAVLTTVFQGVPGADAHLPPQSDGRSSPDLEENSRFGGNSEFCRNYNRRSEPSSSPIFPCDCDPSFSYVSESGFLSTLTYTLISHVDDQPECASSLDGDEDGDDPSMAGHVEPGAPLPEHATLAEERAAVQIRPQVPTALHASPAASQRPRRSLMQMMVG